MPLRPHSRGWAAEEAVECRSLQLRRLSRWELSTWRHQGMDGGSIIKIDIWSLFLFLA